MRLYIIRHADPDYPNNTITPVGHQEVAALAERMAQEGLSRIYTSPMGRARHTAQYTADATGLEPVVLPWTEELDMIAKSPRPMARNGWPGELKGKSFAAARVS